MFSTLEWGGIAVSILALTYCLVQYFAGSYGKTKESFLLSLRNITPIWLAISLGMAWANAPTFWVASGQAYNVGLVGFVWFSLGNILTLAVFGFAAQKVRQHFPEGYTLAGYLKQSHGPIINKTYAISAILLSIVSMSLSVSAITAIISMTSEISRPIASLMLFAIAVTLSYRVGFRATVLVEIVKFIAATAVLFGTIWYLATSPTVTSWVAGIGGVKGLGAELFGTPTAWTAFATFGVITFIGQMSATWVDNNYIQRAFAYKGDVKNIWKTFILAAAFFGSINIACGILGFYGVANNIVVEKGFEQYAMLSIVNQLIGHGAALAMAWMTFISCLGIVDDHINNLNDLIKNDILGDDKYDEQRSLIYTRIGSALLALVVVLFVNVSWVNLAYLILLGNIIRVGIGLSTVGLIFKPNWFDGKITGIVLLISLLVNGVVFTWIKLTNVPEYILPFTLSSFLITPIIALSLSYIKRNNQ